MKKLQQQGLTMIEVMMTTVIIGILVLVFSSVMKHLSQSAAETQAVGQSILSSQQFFAYFERDLFMANEIEVSTAAGIQFIVDCNRLPDYDPNGDYDGDGVENYLDPDIDGDLDQVDNAGNTNTLNLVGFNMADDDDYIAPGETETDGNVDYRIKYFLDGDVFYRQTNINNAGWGNKREIAVGISTLTFSYFGTKSDSTAAALDANGDGIVDFSELDTDGNLTLDFQERQFINTIQLNVTFRPNSNAGKEFNISAEITPPMLPLKAIQRGLGGG